METASTDPAHLVGIIGSAFRIFQLGVRRHMFGASQLVANSDSMKRQSSSAVSARR
jgi:hypothetical protein